MLAINTTLGPRRGELCHLSRRYWDSALLLSDFWNVANSYQAESNDLIRCSSSFESKNVVLFLSTTRNPPPHHLSLGSARGSIGDYYRSSLLHGLIRNELRLWRLRWCKRYASMKGLQYTGWREGAIEALISEATGSRTLRYGLIWRFYVAQIRKYFLEKERCLPSSSAMARWPNNE